MWGYVIRLLQGAWFAAAFPGLCVIDQSILAGVCVVVDQAG